MEAAQANPNVCGGESRSYIDMGVDEEFVASLYAKTEPVRSGVAKMNPTPRQEQILRDLWHRNTIRRTEISKALGVSIGTARRWAEEMEAKVNG